MGVLKRLPMIGKDLLEDTPVSRGCCQHRIAPSGGDTMVTVQRLYHTLPAQSTPSSAFIGHPPTTAITAYISITKNENSYAIKIQLISVEVIIESRQLGAMPFVRDLVPQHSQFRQGIVGVAMPQLPFGAFQ